MALVYLMTFNFLVFSLLVTTVTMPGVTNPLCDLQPQFCQGSQLGTVAGTTAQPSGTISPAQMSAQACGLGGAIGGGIGALGFLAGPLGILTTGAGAVVGCFISQTFFPAQASGTVQQLKTASGSPIGDFTNALGNALQFFGQVAGFVPDSIKFMFAIFGQFPEIGLWLFPFNGAMIILLFQYMAEYVRGVNLGVG